MRPLSDFYVSTWLGHSTQISGQTFWVFLWRYFFKVRLPLKSVDLVSNAILCAWHTVRPNKLKHWSLEQREVYCMTKQGQHVAHAWKNPNSLMVFREVFLQAKLRVRAAGCVTSFLLVGGEVTVVLQESSAQHAAIIFHLGGDLSACRRRTQR